MSRACGATHLLPFAWLPGRPERFFWRGARGAAPAVIRLASCRRLDPRLAAPFPPPRVFRGTVRAQPFRPVPGGCSECCQYPDAPKRGGVARAAVGFIPRWHCVANIYDGKAVRAYVNGSLDSNVSVSAGTSTSTSTDPNNPFPLPNPPKFPNGGIFKPPAGGGARRPLLPSRSAFARSAASRARSALALDVLF